jgi:hypothetical protein
MNRRLQTFAAVLVAVALTGFGVFLGWAMDQSLIPPYGGGWPCYAACVAHVWGFAFVLSLPVLVSRFGKAVAWRLAEW